jgi:hypothetical protein
MVGGVKRRVGVVAGETLTITGNEELNEEFYKENSLESIYSMECSRDAGEHSGQEHLINKRC